ncbi:MAG TPA: glycosyltransferase family 4 protein, partial [Gammaproteobacteria bacterium]|nr:glycosyltransferase family 4 protein [Gammaproteobacteria bacterium]
MQRDDGDLGADGDGSASQNLDQKLVGPLLTGAAPTIMPGVSQPLLSDRSLERQAGAGMRSAFAGLRIAQVPPLIESVPPKGYGGTERVVSVLTEELVRLGCDVTLYATGDSTTSARLRPVVKRSLRLDPACEDTLPYHLLQVERVIQDADRYDLIHFHGSMLHYSAARRFLPRTVTTLHGRLDLPDSIALFREFVEAPAISISLAQRRPLPWLNWVGNVYHGYPEHDFELSTQHDGYLVFLGRICREKRPDRAVRIAADAGYPLKIAAKVDPVDREYFETEIRPLLEEPHVEYLGEIGDRDKQRLLGGALGTLLPIDWPEPFGLTLIEAMACGTPTIAYAHGSVPEIVEDGVTGFIVHNHAEAVAAVEKLPTLDRSLIRRRFLQRFSAARMVKGYLAIYGDLVGTSIRAAS